MHLIMYKYLRIYNCKWFETIGIVHHIDEQIKGTKLSFYLLTN